MAADKNNGCALSSKHLRSLKSGIKSTSIDFILMAPQQSSYLHAPECFKLAVVATIFAAIAMVIVIVITVAVTIADTIVIAIAVLGVVVIVVIDVVVVVIVIDVVIFCSKNQYRVVNKRRPPLKLGLFVALFLLQSFSSDKNSCLCRFPSLLP